MSGRPFSGSYWVSPGRLLAGEYPGALDPEEAQLKLAKLVGAGFTVIVDLTEEDEGLEPYDEVLAEGIRWARLPVRDLSVPTTEEMTRILDTIDEALEGGELVCVHCWGASVGRERWSGAISSGTGASRRRHSTGSAAGSGTRREHTANRRKWMSSVRWSVSGAPARKTLHACGRLVHWASFACTDNTGA